MNLAKTLICFLLAFILTSMLYLALAGANATQGAATGLSLSMLWQYFLIFTYAMAHKLGLVTLGLALFYYFSPAHWPKPILTLIAGFIFALLYNSVLLYGTDNSEFISQQSFAQVFQDYLIYYCVGGMLIALIGSVLCKRLLARK